MSQAAPQALARKWRPNSFESLVGQEHVVKALSHALDTQRLHHAYLFTGTRGVGKTTIARILAKAVNCEQGMSKTPCGQCGACTEISQGRFTDLLEVDAATNTKVDEMRQLLENAMYAPTSGRYKVYVIDEVHMLSSSAFNAMLKTLEEPPGHVLFILATTDPQKIPPTVLSRCLQFGLRQLTPDQIAKHLANILEQESVTAEAGALRLISKAAKGSLRDALSLTDQAIAYSAGSVTEESVRAMLGAVDQQVVVDILLALSKGDGAALHEITTHLATQSAPFGTLLSEIASASYRLSVAKVAGGLFEGDPDDQALIALDGQLSAESLQLIYQIATHAQSELHLAPEDSIGFGMALLRMLAFKPGGQVGYSGGSSAAPSNSGQAQKLPPVTSLGSEAKNDAPVQPASPPAPAQPAQQRFNEPENEAATQVTAQAPVQKSAAKGPSDAARAALAAAKAAMQRGVSSAYSNNKETKPNASVSNNASRALHSAPARNVGMEQPEMGAQVVKSEPQPVKDASPSMASDSEPPPWVTENVSFGLPEVNTKPIQQPSIPTAAEAESSPKPLAESGSASPNTASPNAALQSDSLSTTVAASPVNLTLAQWATLSEQLPASGVARQALVQTELVSISQGDGGITFNLKTPLHRYAEPSVAERLEELLRQHFGTKIRVEFSIGEVTVTAHIQHTEVRKVAMEAARESIATDPFVQALQREMGAEILDGSQRPLHSQGPADV